MMDAKRFVIWVAVSSEEQAERYSPQEQLELARRHVARWGGVITAELSVSESRSIVLFSDACERIPAYAQLHELIRRRAFDVLICYDATRLGRKSSLVMAILELCAEAGILVYELESPPPTLEPNYSYDNKLMGALKAVGSQREVDKLRERLRYGYIGRVKAGRFPGREPPYGYAYRYAEDGRRYTVTVEEEAAVVREIFSLYLDGHGMDWIARSLRGRGVPSPGARGRGGATAAAVWRKTGIAAIIERAWTYAGVSRLAPNGKLLAEGRGQWEPIISSETAERALAERVARKANRRRANAPNRLSSIVWCVQCQKPMRQVINDDGSIFDNYDKRRKTPTRRRAMFYCQPSHPGASVSTKRVLAALRVALDELTRVDLSALLEPDDGRAAELLSRITAHRNAVKRHQEGLRRADTAFVSGVMDEERYQEQVKRLRAAIEAESETIVQLEAMLANEEAHGGRQERLQEIIAAGYAMLEIDDIAAANAWLCRYVQVWVEANNVVEVRWL